jgi:DNA repair protein RecN (Recombination protein N)
MLTQLIVRDFAVIDRLELDLHPGFTAITGETGAGKSILLGALDLVLGGRARAEVIRSTATQAVVEAIFELDGDTRAWLDPILEARGFDVDDQLLVRRIVSRSGKSRAYINGSAARAATLREVTAGLIDISGQHEHYSLLDSSRHLLILDAFAGLDDERVRVAEAVAKLRDLQREINDLKQNERDRVARLDYLGFQIAEVQDAQLKQEDDGIEDRLRILRSADKLREQASTALMSLYDGKDSAIDVVSRAASALQRAASTDPRFGTVLEHLESARLSLDEAAMELRGYGDNVEVDPREVAALEDRAVFLSRLKRKHGDTVAQILGNIDGMISEVARLENAEGRVVDATREAQELTKLAMAQARTLSERRKQAARRLEAIVQEELGSLGLPSCAFEVAFDHVDAEGNSTGDVTQASAAGLTSRGLDAIVFMLAPNVGQELKPLAKTASGGELSRVMLALKNALIQTDPVPTYVFDEVDAGIGGRVADEVGKKMRIVAAHRQVLTVTHLAQIASCADQHLVVDKTHHETYTETTLRSVSGQERVQEVARMLAGAAITDKTLAHATEMLERY